MMRTFFIVVLYLNSLFPYAVLIFCSHTLPLLMLRSLPPACNVEVLVGFDVGSQNIFAAQTNLQSKMGAILQRITKMAPISCSSGQVPLVQVGILAMDSNGQATQLDFTDDADVLFEAFKGLRSRGPFVLMPRPSRPTRTGSKPGMTMLSRWVIQTVSTLSLYPINFT